MNDYLESKWDWQSVSKRAQKDLIDFMADDGLFQLSCPGDHRHTRRNRIDATASLAACRMLMAASGRKHHKLVDKLAKELARPRDSR